MTQGLVYIGKIISLEPIPDADFIVSATVVCGSGGKWRGIVRKVDFQVDDLCVVFLPDSQLDPEIHFWMPFMKDTHWRVKMRRFKGSPSEVVITPHITSMAYSKEEPDLPVGSDITIRMRVTKYQKPISPHLQGIAKGPFPGFIPKTDEPNYQSNPGMVEFLHGKAYYITEKVDGSSTTAYKYKGVFGVCSRNLELERNEENGYWKIAIKYQLEENLPEGIAIQWETCGPKIQGNPMGLTELEGYVFSGYDIKTHEYLELDRLIFLCELMKMKMCKVEKVGTEFDMTVVDMLGEGFYANGKPREGVVVRSLINVEGKPISFKVINLGYDK